jgi:predicted glycogen debranching enzyme
MEWLETNGIGGFASSTQTGLNSRRYHGLLTAATTPPAGRTLLLSKVEETLIAGGVRYELSTNRYTGAIHPEGYRHLVDFQLDPMPRWTYRCGGVTVTRSLFLVHGENTVCIEYRVDGEAALEIRPLVAFRGFHATTRANDSLDTMIDEQQGIVSIAPYSQLPRMYFGHNANVLDDKGYWYYGFEYECERERGLDCVEDLYSPFALRFDLADGAVIVASTEYHSATEFNALRDAELARRHSLTVEQEPLIRVLTRAADQFIAERGEEKTVIAGYHWFADWGRDTMIALPGISLATGRPEVARSILAGFSRYVDQGMLPNRFPDSGETPDYNTVDATLWYFDAIRAYVEYTGDFEFVRERLYSVLKDILDCHICGTRYGIGVDSDGLLRAGVDGVQLTWMDAKIGDEVVTPRHGKPVEIQALWYNALRIFAVFAQRFGDESSLAIAREFADLAQRSFREKFIDAETGCLYDVVDGDYRDASIRPNQVLAASLHYPLLSMAEARRMLRAVERDLLTPYGLRTLSPRDPRYVPFYTGGVRQRDSAYHQGTVWPWLMGPFISAYVKAHGRTAPARAQARKWIEPLERYAMESGGQIPEIFDAESPHDARGCIAQAWSVAELLRCCVEDIFERRSESVAAQAA